MSKLANRVHNGCDVIDSRDIIERIEELESEIETQTDDKVNYPDGPDEELTSELATLHGVVEEIDNNAGDKARDGVGLIRDSYFQTYAEEFADDIGAIDRNASWPLNYIDWEKAAADLQQDYTMLEWDGVTYWFR